MPCDSRRQPTQTAEERKQEIDAALKRLVEKLANGQAKVVIGSRGQLAFQGHWQQGSGVTDACAYRALTQANCFELRVAVKKAEMLAGRAANVAMLGHGGQHSHDGGASWHENH